MKRYPLTVNYCKGPDHTNKLVDVLIYFRQDKITLAAGIEAMFHQVKVSPSHVDLLWFLWWEDGDFKKLAKEYQMLVHLFWTTSSPSCAGFALHQTIEDNKEELDSSVTETLLDNFYADDYLKSAATTEEAKKLIPSYVNCSEKENSDWPSGLIATKMF